MLLVAAGVAGLSWTLLKPGLQGPDELSHFTYVQRIVEHREIPWRPTGETYTKSADGSEAAVAHTFAGLGPLGVNISARPLWTRPDEAVWRAYDRNSVREGTGETSSYRNGPVYYLYESIPYALAYNGSILDRLYAMRMANVVLYLAGLVFIWLLAGQVFGRGPLQLVAAAGAAFVPALMNIVATVNPDMALFTEWAAGFWLIALVLRRGPSVRLVGALAGVCALAALTHPRGIPLLLPAVIAVAIAVARARGWRRVTPLTVTVAAWAVYLPVMLNLAAKGPNANAREFMSYVWQFYLPRLSSMKPTVGPQGFGAQQAWSDHFWGALGQLEVLMPSGLADAIWLAMRLGLLAFAIALIVRWRSVRSNSDLVFVLGSAMLGLLLVLHLTAYRALIAFAGDPILAGRYLLSLVPLLGIAAAVVVSALPRRLAPAGGGLVVAASLGSLFMATALVLARFYA
jgi:4-amino-4-deoxy-L-arabinose transferase-like glycosyltransferase